MTTSGFKMTMTQVSKFNHIATARSFASGCTKIMAILHGDDGLYWLTTPAAARKLSDVGYELIEYVS